MTYKQVAYAWLNNKLSPEKVNPEHFEFEEIMGKRVPPSVAKKADGKIRDEIAKWRKRYSSYLEKD
jgi:hypothetical protein